jgi:hypothetical protein
MVAVMAACFGQAAMALDAARLGSELTAAGADKSASADGVPAWAEPSPALPGWSHGQRRGDFFAYKNDKPLYSIDASNVDKYAEKLSPGQIAVLKQVNGYRMDVYPSRRTCATPSFVAENTRKNVGFAKIAADGFSLDNAYLPGVPFPMPENGTQVMWNNKLHYRGVGLEARNHITLVSPRKGSDTWIRTAVDAILYYPWASKSGTTFDQVGRVEGSLYLSFTSPTALAGQAAVITSTAQAQETFYYFPGQRRTRRMPSYAYDAPQIGFENQYTVDESYVFSGPLDRFEWKLLGKQEMLVPYNTFGVYDAKANIDEVALRDSVSPDRMRYELHRVWVVEATVRSGMRHSAPRRLFYVDEDSWNLVGAVDFDAQGKVWKVREGLPIPVFETGSCDAPGMTQYNLADGRYLFEYHSIGAGVDFRWMDDESNDPRLKKAHFTSDNLRATSER